MSNLCHPSYHKAVKKNLKELLKVQEYFAKDPRVKEFGYNDISTFEWLYNKYVGKPYDPKNIPITPTDVNRYKEGVVEFTSSLGKIDNPAARWFKLPKAIMRKIPEANTFFEGMTNATSFRQANLKESSIHLDKMMNGLYSMILSGEYHKTAKWSKKEFKNYQKLEARLKGATKKSDREAILKEIYDAIGIKDGENNPIGGVILRRFNDLLTFNTVPKNSVEREISREWAKLRTRSAKNLLNGIEQAKAVINTVNDKTVRTDLVKAIERLQNAADRIIFEGSGDQQVYYDQSKYFDIKPQDIRVYDAKTGLTRPYEVIDASGKKKVPKQLTKYAPEYVIDLANAVRNVTDYASNPRSAKWDGKSSAEIKTMIESNVDLGRMINRLKARTEVDGGWFSSMDPAFYLQKYVHDVAHFNYSTRVNLEYKKAADKMFELTRKTGINTEVGEYARHMLNILTEIRDSGLNNYEGSFNEMDAMVRWINGVEYISKLGWSARGGLRNLSQTIFDWVRFGFKGRRTEKAFFNTSYGGEVSENQLKRFGFLFGEGESRGRGAATTEIITAGSLEKATPAGTEMTKEGGLQRAKVGAIGKIAEGTAEFAEKGGFTKPLQWAENYNRINTFKRALAVAHTEMMHNYEYYKHRMMKDQNLTNPPSDKAVMKHIEHLAGNMAAKAVGDLHFHYDNWQKAKVLQLKRGLPDKDISIAGKFWQKSKAGPIIGQFQTYRFALFDLQWQMMKDANRARKAGKYGMFETDVAGKLLLNDKGMPEIMPEIQQAMRYLSLYTLLVPTISAVSNLDFGQLIQNETYDTVERFYEYYTADETDDDQLEDKYGQFFGKTALMGNLGPFVSDLLTFAELMDWYNQTPEELQETMKLKYDPNDPDWRYKMARIFNIQGSRTAWHSLPALLAGQQEKFWRIETGLYAPKYFMRWLGHDEGGTFQKRRRTFLDESPYSPYNWLYTGKFLPKLEKKAKRNDKAISVLDEMLGDRK